MFTKMYCFPLQQIVCAITYAACHTLYAHHKCSPTNNLPVRHVQTATNHRPCSTRALTSRMLLDVLYMPAHMLANRVNKPHLLQTETWWMLAIHLPRKHPSQCGCSLTVTTQTEVSINCWTRFTYQQRSDHVSLLLSVMYRRLFLENDARAAFASSADSATPVLSGKVDIIMNFMCPWAPANNIPGNTVPCSSRVAYIKYCLHL